MSLRGPTRSGVSRRGRRSNLNPQVGDCFARNNRTSPAPLRDSVAHASEVVCTRQGIPIHLVSLSSRPETRAAGRSGEIWLRTRRADRRRHGAGTIADCGFGAGRCFGKAPRLHPIRGAPALRSARRGRGSNPQSAIRNQGTGPQTQATPMPRQYSLKSRIHRGQLKELTPPALVHGPAVLKDRCHFKVQSSLSPTLRTDPSTNRQFTAPLCRLMQHRPM